MIQNLFQFGHRKDKLKIEKDVIMQFCMPKMSNSGWKAGYN